MDLCGFLICVAFCLVSGPFLCCFTVFSAGETQIWPGDVRVVAFAVFLFVVFVFPWFASFVQPKGSYFLQTFRPLSLSGPSLRARSAETEGKKTLKLANLFEDRQSTPERTLRWLPLCTLAFSNLVADFYSCLVSHPY